MDLKLALIPIIAGVIGYGTNWLAVRMMFQPLEYRGVGPIGWQGVIPAKAAKMAAISVEKGIAKLGSLGEFYRRLGPDEIADHVVVTKGKEVRALVADLIARENPELWGALPEGLRVAVLDRVESELPALVNDVTHDIGRHIDDLMDLKLMVVRHMRENPALTNTMFAEVGEREFRFIVNSGAWFGFLLGLVQMAVFAIWDTPLLLPIAGLFVGYLTNWLALNIIFGPVEPRQVGPWKVQGLFLRRQDEVAEVYARLVSEEVLTLANIVDEMLTGPKSDRTRRLLEDRLRPAVDEALGAARPAVRLAIGSRRYEAIRTELATGAVGTTMEAFREPAFNAARARMLSGLIAERMAALEPTEFAELLRSAFEEDEWQLIAVGAALGGLAGLAQMAFVF